MAYCLEIDTQLKNTVTLSENLAARHFRTVPQRIVVRSGARQCEARVIFKEGLEKDYIKLSRDIFEYLLLPLELPYDIVLEQEELNIGPVIGLLLHNKDEKITPERLKKHLDFTLQYPVINGLLYIFSTEGIDMKNRTIHGYYFDPCAKERDTPWKAGIFPYPHAIYRRIGLKDDIYQSLTKEIGNKIFNYPWFGKKQMWDWLSQFDSVRKYLPETRPLKTVSDFWEMIRKYPQVYIKPAAGTKGFGVIKVVLKENTCFVEFNKKEAENTAFAGKEAAEFIERLLVEHPNYLIQQSIDLLSYKERKIDFRFIMQKDHTKEWQCSGIIARFGKKGSIATNFQRAGYTRTFAKALKKATKFKYKEIYKKEQEMIQVCKKIAYALDKMGNCYGDFGMDVALDQELNIWVIEVNNRRHEHRLPLYIHDEQMYYKVKSNPVRYAKSLAGF